jgi:tRNA threonylcarbamoyladenosine biosynthesis protein TsaE
MRIISKSVKDTLNIGRRLARHLQKGDIICLFGQLGSGKTVLTKGIALGLGIKKNRIISPSFVLIRQYSQARLPFYHFDLYRLKNPKDIFVLGYEEYLYDDGITVIEWADRLKVYLPDEYLRIGIVIKEKNSRLFKLEGAGRHYEDILKALKID